jgi:hypothetical protein
MSERKINLSFTLDELAALIAMVQLVSSVRDAQLGGRIAGWFLHDVDRENVELQRQAAIAWELRLHKLINQ